MRVDTAMIADFLVEMLILTKRFNSAVQRKPLLSLVSHEFCSENDIQRTASLEPFEETLCQNDGRTSPITKACVHMQSGIAAPNTFDIKVEMRVESPPNGARLRIRPSSQDQQQSEATDLQR